MSGEGIVRSRIFSEAVIVALPYALRSLEGTASWKYSPSRRFLR